MKVKPFVHHLFVSAFFVLVLITVTTSFSDYEASDEPNEPGSICKYARSAEVERVCSPVLSLVSKAKLGNDKIYRVARDLSFQNADWVQESGGAPLMPFDSTDMPHNTSSIESLLKLASFWVMDIDFAHQTDASVGICGLLSVGITRNRTLPYMSQRWTPWFHKSPGYSDLTIVFEGLYVESEENDGERVLCLLGTSLFPFSEGFADPYEYWKDHGCKQKEQSPSIKNDQIMLVLRYPQNFTLINRAILGEMRSIHRKSDAKYFDKVHISSLMSHESKYLFASEELVASACNPYPYQDTLINEGIQIFKGSKFCNVFQMFGSEIFDIVVVSKCNGMTKSCNNLGPFVLGRKMEGTNQRLDKFRLVITNSRCVPGHNSNKHRTANVYAVFRAISSQEDRYTSQARSGLSGMTISAEGTWNSSSGQLCMVGCVGTEKGSDGCNSRLCLYFPKTFTITQRSIFLGSISSLRKTDPYASLIFKKELRPLDLWNRYNDYCKSHLFYKYSKIELATDLLKKNNFGFGTIIKTLLILRYPFIEDYNNITGLSLLSGELGFSAKALPKTLHDKSPTETIVGLEVLTLGPMFGRHWTHEEQHSCKGKTADVRPSTSASAGDRLPLNISAHLSLSGAYYSHISELFLEGLYDPFGGKMCLIGCRNVPKSEKFSNDNLNLEGNMDCLIEVKVEYSSKTTRWLINPTAKVSIVSQREKDNTFYFRPISLKTALITYRENYREIIFRQNFELIFRVLLLLASIAFVSSQLVYVKEKVEAIPFISLAMLGVQISGYGIPLVMNIEILFKWKEYYYPESRSIRMGKGLWLEMLDCIMKFLLLVVFVLSLRLCQKVWESRKLTDKPLSLKHNIPSEKRVFLLTCMIHIIGFLVVHSNSNVNSETSVQLRTYEKLPGWVSDMEKYMALVQDLFLLPQIMGNRLWLTHGKPLSKVYYLGFSVLRLFLRGYEYIREPVFSPYFHKYDSTTSSIFFTKSENCVIMVIVAALAIIVHVQQKNWNFKLI